jgi:hypothetical protein
MFVIHIIIRIPIVCREQILDEPVKVRLVKVPDEVVGRTPRPNFASLRDSHLVVIGIRFIVIRWARMAYLMSIQKVGGDR